MQTSLPNFSEKLRRSILDLLWRQWSALGVAGHVEQGGNIAVDPESLLLFSSVFARHDARLFDEIADWLEQNGDWINLLRMARLQREHDLGDITVLGALAAHLTRRSTHAKWKVFAKKPPTIAPPAPLFPHLPQPRRPDENFLRWGWLRSPLESRGLSKAARPNQPASFLLKLRALFGIQSRAEIVAWLIAHDSGHPAQIARETGYFRGSVQNVLNELECSGQIHATRSGREKRFTAPPENWLFLLTWPPNSETAFPEWIPWAVLFTIIRRYHDLILLPSFTGYSADLQSIEVERTVGPLLNRLSVEASSLSNFTKPPNRRSTAEINSWLDQLIPGLV